MGYSPYQLVQDFFHHQDHVENEFSNIQIPGSRNMMHSWCIRFPHFHRISIEICIPGSSRSVKYLPFGRLLGWKGSNFTHLTWKIQVLIHYNYILIIGQWPQITAIFQKVFLFLIPRNWRRRLKVRRWSFMVCKMPWSHQNPGFENPFDPSMFPQKGKGLF